MVGAKEFAMNRKVIEAKKKNPLLDRISMPIWMKSHESETKSNSGSFLDSLNSNSREEKHKFPILDKQHDTRTINPILEAFNQHKASMHHPKPKPRIMDKVQEKEEDKSESFSEELANQITYKVFKNIKNYLDADSRKSNGTKQIKLEISL